MNVQLIISFLILAIPAFFTPGPNNLMLFSSVMKFGLQRTVPHAAGVVTGFSFMVAALGMGAGEVFTLFPQLKSILKYIAAVYFLWMAWHLLGFKLGAQKASARPLTYIEAVLFQWINPKAWAMGASFVAVFVVPGAGRYWSIGGLTLGCLMLGPFSSLMWMFFGQQLQRYLAKSGAERFVGPVLAGLMVVAVILFLL